MQTKIFLTISFFFGVAVYILTGCGPPDMAPPRGEVAKILETHQRGMDAKENA